MKQGYSTEDDLRRRFGELRSADGSEVTPFEQMWSQAGRMRTDRRRRLRHYRLAGAAVLFLMIGGGIVRQAMFESRRLDHNLEELLSFSATSEQWQGPLDFLLVTPGSEFLTSTPQFDLQELWSLQIDFGQEVQAR